METKVCNGCGIKKPVDEFYKRRRSNDGLAPRCKLCANEQAKTHRTDHKDYWANKQRVYLRNLRDEVIAAYGNKCACCGESILQFLTLDHVNGRGRQTRSQVRSKYHYRDAKKRNYPPDYQVLCFNCNCTKGFYGVCPHTLLGVKKEEAVQDGNSQT